MEVLEEILKIVSKTKHDGFGMDFTGNETVEELAQHPKVCCHVVACFNVLTVFFYYSHLWVDVLKGSKAQNSLLFLEFWGRQIQFLSPKSMGWMVEVNDFEQFRTALFSKEWILQDCPSPADIFEGTAVTLSKKRWDWDADIWKANVVKKDVWDDSIVFGAQCCKKCRAKYPAAKAWQKFNSYKHCEFFLYSPTFSPLDSLAISHGAYSIGTCEDLI